MSGFAPRLPLMKSTIDGFETLKTINSVVAQNLKMLILTSPGERVMEPEFGVGIRSYFFEPMRDDTFVRVQQRINSQVNVYMPFITILDIAFDSVANTPNNMFDYDEHYLGLTIEYRIDSIGAIEVLDILI
mgnify:FL=1